jgi:hypothetical protein
MRRSSSGCPRVDIVDGSTTTVRRLISACPQNRDRSIRRLLGDVKRRREYITYPGLRAPPLRQWAGNLP